jgi:hypothetical protein
VKLHYFKQDNPDEDDKDLARAIEHGDVPKGCLLGGKLVRQFLDRGEKPCSDCLGPRDKCGGDPFVSDPTDEKDLAYFRWLFGDSESVRAMTDAQKKITPSPAAPAGDKAPDA